MFINNIKFIFISVFMITLFSGYIYYKQVIHKQQQNVDKLKNELVVQKVNTHNLRTLIQEMNTTTKNKLFEAIQKQKKKDLQYEVAPHTTNKDISNTVDGWYKLTI